MEQPTLLSSKQSTGIPEADMYKKRLERSPHDASAWMGLLRVARSSNNDELLYAAYSSALAQYPSSGHLLATFVELELSRGNKSSAESIFNNNLFNVPSIELWQ
ncbi:mRNA 3'-end-processing protein rna14, partial [Coemansia sp. RSA 518]